MLQQPMMEKLQALKLQGMLEGLEQQEQDAAVRELSFLDRLALLIDRQWTWRQNQVLARRLQASRLKGAACVENIDYRAERGLNRTVIRGLAQDSTWVKNHEHIFVLGPTGVGKSYVASALAQKACRDGYAVYYTRAAALFRDLNLARADGSLRQLLRRLNRIDVLVVDDWAMAPMAESERRDFVVLRGKTDFGTIMIKQPDPISPTTELTTKRPNRRKDLTIHYLEIPTS